MIKGKNWEGGFQRMKFPNVPNSDWLSLEDTVLSPKNVRGSAAFSGKRVQFSRRLPACASAFQHGMKSGCSDKVGGIDFLVGCCKPGPSKTHTAQVNVLQVIPPYARERQQILSKSTEMSCRGQRLASFELLKHPAPLL